MSVRTCARAAAAAVAGGMLTFAAVLARAGCRSCETEVLWLPVLAGGVLWGLAAVLRAAPAAGLGLFLLAGHLGLVLRAPVPACLPCLILLGAESVAAGLLLSPVPGFRPSVVVSGVLLAGAGLTGGMAVSGWAWKPAGPDPLRGYLREGSAPYGTVVFVLVRGDCGRCPDGVGLARAVEESGKARAVIVEAWTEAGRWLRWEYRLRRLPAFVARRGGEVVAVQSGGGVDEFLRRLGP